MRTFDLSVSRLLLLAALASACSDSVDKPGPESGQTEPGVFESDLPASAVTHGSAAGRGETSADSSDNGASAPSTIDPNAPSDESNSDGDAQRAIVEADIIQLDGDRLYALSRVAGLTIIDATDPARLAILGRYRELNGTPFEMYLKGGVVLAMYSGWGQYVKSGESYQYVQTSKVLALDVQDPRAVAPIGSFDIAGEVSDSRIVGDVMYVVGFQNGYCWGCAQNQPRTTVLSLDVHDPRQVRKVDELTFADATDNYGWKRSVTVTDQRMYVAGPEYGASQPQGSTIQVIDISNPNGDLVEGTTVEAAGQVSSRWQMDEYQGVLRVISQIPTWWQDRNLSPMVQTFRVDSAQSLIALGNTALRIPPNEMLNSVRFDGVRGYAITSERSDPLFTLDLSDPANPRQVGELVMPGWVYHMEPRGDRVIGLGFDQGNAQGGVTVSIFDVSDLAAPKMLDRVNFGGSWASLPEDQDRIHKAFRILPDKSLILVPFSGWGDVATDAQRPGCYPYYYGSYRSGVQLVDLQGDDLNLRGAAPSRGQARRALIHKDKLMTISDEAVDSYDLANRDQPAEIGRLNIARYVTNALPLAGEHVARVNQDWYGNNAAIDFVTLADVDRPEVSISELNLSAALRPTSPCGGEGWIGRSFVSGNQINITYQRWEYLADSAGKSNFYVRGLLSYDASDPRSPTLLSKLEEPEDQNENSWYEFYDYYNYGYNGSPLNAVRTERALVFLEQRQYALNPRSEPSYETRLRVIDLSNPAAPTQATLALAKADGYSGLVVDGGDVMISHFENVADGKARFYLDRIDLSDPKAPKLASKVNVPGSLLHYDRAHGRILTSELRRVAVGDLTLTECYQRFAYADWSYPSNNYDENARNTCTGYTQTLHMARFVPGGAVLEGSYALPENERVSSSSLGDSRVAAVISRGYAGWYGGGRIAVDCWGSCGYGGAAQEPSDLLTLGGFDTGTLVSGRLTVSDVSDPWWGFWGAPPVYATGTRALVQSQNDALVLDMTDPTAPSIMRKVPLYSPAVSLNASGNLVLMALGTNGVQRVDL